MARVLAFDLGGTRLKFGVVLDASVEHLQVVDLTAPTADAALSALREAGRELAGRVDGAGLCVPGLVDDDGTIVSLPGKLEGIVGVDLRKWLRTELGLDAVVCNDAIAYGIGEATHGAGAPFGRVVVVTIGTGVGVAVIEAGRPVGRGPLGGGLMGGFIPIASGGGEDTAGGHGTIEALCRAQRLDEVGAEAWRPDLVRALVALANAHGPDAIVVGGGPIAGDASLLDGVQDAVNAALWSGFSVRVLPAAFGDAAALVGLAELWRSRS